MRLVVVGFVAALAACGAAGCGGDNDAPTLDGPLTAEAVSTCLESNDFKGVEVASAGTTPQVIGSDANDSVATVLIAFSEADAQGLADAQVPENGIPLDVEVNGKAVLFTDPGMSAESLNLVRGCSTEGVGA